jgi:hypothetical protein
MTLLYARNVHDGVQDDQGDYITVRADLTVCEPCLADKGWGYTVYVDDVPGDKCELCDATE